MPSIVFRPDNASEASEALKICAKHSIPVTPRGAGSGVTGGAVPDAGGLVLSMEKMNRIIEIDADNMVAVVEPGVITADLQREALSYGLLYPPDPASLDQSSLGGNVAEIAGGPRAVKYGTTRDYVLGLDFLLYDGTAIHHGGKFVKNATGYNLTGIILGSEGTLGIITKLYLKLVPAPGASIDLLIPFDTMEQAAAAVTLLHHHKIMPATIEFMEDSALRLVKETLQLSFPHADAGAHLLIQLDAPDEEVLDLELQRLYAIDGLPSDSIYAASSGPQREALWTARRSIRTAIEKRGDDFFAEDCVVPRFSIPEFLGSVKELLATYHVSSVFFGHAGDGNVHIDILQGEVAEERWKKIIPEIKEQIYRTAKHFGGTITGEHGIGAIRKNFLPLEYSPDEIELMKGIKKAFDPGMKLNPGKIFPDN